MNGNKEPYTGRQANNDPRINPAFGVDDPYRHSESGTSTDYHGNVNSPNENIYEEVTPDAVWDRGQRKISGDGGQGNLIGGIGLVIVLISIVISTFAFVFSWFFYVGFVMNIISAVLSVIGTVMGIVGGTRNSRLGMQWGTVSTVAVILGLLAIMFSGIIFTCTGCAACFFASR